MLVKSDIGCRAVNTVLPVTPKTLPVTSLASTLPLIKLTLSQSTLQLVALCAGIGPDLRFCRLLELLTRRKFVPVAVTLPLSTIPTVVPLLKSSITIGGRPAPASPRSTNMVWLRNQHVDARNYQGGARLHFEAPGNTCAQVGRVGRPIEPSVTD